MKKRVLIMVSGGIAVAGGLGCNVEASPDPSPAPSVDARHQEEAPSREIAVPALSESNGHGVSTWAAYPEAGTFVAVGRDETGRRVREMRVSRHEGVTTIEVTFPQQAILRIDAKQQVLENTFEGKWEAQITAQDMGRDFQAHAERKAIDGVAYDCEGEAAWAVATAAVAVAACIGPWAVMACVSASLSAVGAAKDLYDCLYAPPS